MERFKMYSVFLREALSSTQKNCQGPENGGGSRTLIRTSGRPYILKRNIIYIILIIIPMQTAEEVEIRGERGGNATLPCHMEGRETEGLKVYWQTKDEDLMVWVYSDGAYQQQYVDQRFHHRTYVSVPEISSGDLSLNIRQLQFNDSREYQCIVIRKGRTADTYSVKLTVREPEDETGPLEVHNSTNVTTNNTDVSHRGRNQHLGLICSPIIIIAFFVIVYIWSKRVPLARSTIPAD